MQLGSIESISPENGLPLLFLPGGVWQSAPRRRKPLEILHGDMRRNPRLETHPPRCLSHPFNKKPVLISAEGSCALLPQGAYRRGACLSSLTLGVCVIGVERLGTQTRSSNGAREVSYLRNKWSILILNYDSILRLPVVWPPSEALDEVLSQFGTWKAKRVCFSPGVYKIRN
jgi:hypothetical protein